MTDFLLDVCSDALAKIIGELTLPNARALFCLSKPLAAKVAQILTITKKVDDQNVNHTSKCVKAYFTGSLCVMQGALKRVGDVRMEYPTVSCQFGYCIQNGRWRLPVGKTMIKYVGRFCFGNPHIYYLRHAFCRCHVNHLHGETEYIFYLHHDRITHFVIVGNMIARRRSAVYVNKKYGGFELVDYLLRCRIEGRKHGFRRDNWATRRFRKIQRQHMDNIIPQSRYIRDTYGRTGSYGYCQLPEVRAMFQEPVLKHNSRHYKKSLRL